MPGLVDYIYCTICNYDYTREELIGRLPQNLEVPVDKELLKKVLGPHHWQVTEPWRGP